MTGMRERPFLSLDKFAELRVFWEMVFAMGMKEELALALMAGLEAAGGVVVVVEEGRAGPGGNSSMIEIRVGTPALWSMSSFFQLQSGGAPFGTDSFSLPVALSSKLRGYPAASICADLGDP